MVRHDDLAGHIPAAFKEVNLISVVKSIMSDLQSKYARNGFAVDVELRQALVETMRRSGEDFELTADQKEIFRQLDDLKAEGTGWSELESPASDVKMWMKYN